MNKYLYWRYVSRDASDIMGKDLSKRSLIIDDDVINLLYCKTSTSTGFENESEFGVKMLAFL